MIHLKEILFMQKIFGSTLGVFGIFLLSSEPIYFGLIFIFFAINAFSTEGFEMNLENKTYRNINSIFGVNYGKWKTYPEIEYISVIKTKQSKSFEGTSTRIITDVIHFNMFFNGNKHITFYKTKSLEEARKAMRELEKNLEVNISDKTMI